MIVTARKRGSVYLATYFAASLKHRGSLLAADSAEDQEESLIENVAQVHMTEAELAHNLHAVLEKVRNGEPSRRGAR